MLDYLPVVAVDRYRDHVVAIQGHLTSGDKKAAERQLGLLRAELVNNEVDVPVRTVRR